MCVCGGGGGEGEGSFESQLGYITFVEITMKSLLRSFSPSADPRKAVQLLVKVCAQVLFNGLEG